MTDLKNRLRNPGLPVLFINDPNGDRFEFGTLEELENEAEAINEEAGTTIAEVRESTDLLHSLDFEAYEDEINVSI